MKSVWNSCKAAFAMFSKIPVPMVDWNKENMKYMMCFFPFVGAVIGVLTWLTGCILGNHVKLEPFFLTVILTVIPVVVTGGIHVDGKHMPPIGFGHIAKHFDLRNSGVIDEYVHIPKRRFCLCKQRFHRICVADIRAYAENLCAVFPKRFRKCQRLLFASAVVKNDIITEGRKLFGTGRADSARRTVD